MVTEPMRPEFLSTTSTRRDAMPGRTRGKSHYHREPQQNQPSHRETILSVRVTFAMDGLASEKAESTTDYAPRLSVAVDGDILWVANDWLKVVGPSWYPAGSFVRGK
jgi:hypothetical protein